MFETNNEFEFLFRSLKAEILKLTNIEINPTVLIGDDADAITNGFKSVFELEKVRILILIYVHL